MKRQQLALFETGEDLPMFTTVPDEAPAGVFADQRAHDVNWMTAEERNALDANPLLTERLPAAESGPTYKIVEAHWSGRGKDGYAVVEERPGRRPLRLGTFPTRQSAEWLLRRCEAAK